MSVFSIRLKELRNKANLSQQELSKIIGISKSSINMYERGEREPGLETVGAFADYFDVQTDYLLGKHDDKRSLTEGKKYNRLILQTLDGFRRLHGYDKKQMEVLLDWENMYSDLENGRILGDAGMLKTIQNTLNLIDKPENSTIFNDNKKNPPEMRELSEGEKMWLELYHRLSEETKAVLITTLVKFDKAPADTQQLALDLIRVALGDQK